MSRLESYHSTYSSISATVPTRILVLEYSTLTNTYCLVGCACNDKMRRPFKLCPFAIGYVWRGQLQGRRVLALDTRYGIGAHRII